MDFVILGIVGLALGLAIGYIVKAKKSGKKCIGCPDGGSCGSCGGSCGSCHSCASKQEDSEKK